MGGGGGVVLEEGSRVRDLWPNCVAFEDLQREMVYEHTKIYMELSTTRDRRRGRKRMKLHECNHRGGDGIVRKEDYRRKMHRKPEKYRPNRYTEIYICSIYMYTCYVSMCIYVYMYICIDIYIKL